MLEERYISGAYLDQWPDWHVEISPWSARQIERMLLRHALQPQTVCEVGCGAGGVLRQLQLRMPDDREFWGYDISPQAIALAESRANDRLHFQVADITKEQHLAFDLLLVIDVFEHVENCFEFLRALRPLAPLKIFHIPLDLSVRSVLGSALCQNRQRHGHIHYFTKGLALQTLRDVGYEILDSFYTSPALDLPVSGWKNEMRRQLMMVPRKLAFALDADLAVHSLGGWSLMVLAR